MIIRFIARDLYWGARAIAARMLLRRPRWADWRRGILRGLPGGLAEGWTTFGPGAVSESNSHRVD